MRHEVPTRFDGRGCTDIRRLIDIIRWYPGHRVIGQSSAPVRLFRQRRVSVLWQARSIHFALCDAHTTIFAPGTPGKLPERDPRLLFFESICHARRHAARFDIFSPFCLSARGNRLHSTTRAIPNSRVIPNTKQLTHVWVVQSYSATSILLFGTSMYRTWKKIDDRFVWMLLVLVIALCAQGIIYIFK